MMNHSLVTAEAAASAAVLVGTGLLDAIAFKTDGTNNVTVNVFDNNAASGKRLIPADTIVTTSASNRTASIVFDPPMLYSDGVYVQVTTAGAVGFMVYHRRR